MGRADYLVIQLVTIVIPLVVDRIMGLGVLSNWRRLLRTLVPMFLVLAAINVVFILNDVWWFNPRRTLPFHLFHVWPVEDLLFFVVFPLNVVTGHEFLARLLRRRS